MHLLFIKRTKSAQKDGLVRRGASELGDSCSWLPSLSDAEIAADELLMND